MAIPGRGAAALLALLMLAPSVAAADAARLRLPIADLSDPLGHSLPAPESAAPMDAAPLALANPYLGAPDVEVSVSGGRKPSSPVRKRRSPRTRRASNRALTPERAQALLRSFTLPGWGQATLGHPTSGVVFGVIEAGVWGSFLAFRIQDQLRRDASVRTARIYAGVDLNGRDDEFRRLVGAFASSAEYNLLVVARDAANQYYDDPQMYRQYIAEHSLSGANAWAWQDEASFDRYGAQRKDAHRAALRANTALALAIGNRILSVLHAARIASRSAGDAPAPRSWNFEVRPVGGDDPTAYRFGLRARF